MLGIRSSAHHPTTRSAATTPAAAAAAPLRPAPRNKRRPSVLQKQLSDTAQAAQNDSEALAGTGVEDDSAWPDIPREELDENDERDEGEDDKTGEVGEEQSMPALALDIASEGPQQTGDAAAEQDKREGDGGDGKDGAGTDTYTRRASSPLSELSPAPDDDESPNQEERDGAGEERGEQNTDAMGGSRSQSTDPAHPGSLSSDAHATANTSQSLSYPGLAGNVVHQATTGSPFSAILSDLTIDGLPPSSPLPGTSSQLPHASSSPPTSSPGKPTSENAQAGPSGLASSSLSKGGPTQKFSILLELNAELFKVCQAFVASGYVLQDALEAQPFSKRLQSNLTWMSAHVDGVKLAAEVPETDPPVLAPSVSHVVFPEGVLERISKLYAQLPIVFAKDIARRDQKLALASGALRNSVTPSLLPPSGIGVKRERPDSSGYAGRESPTSAKRRDTGEGKSMASPSTPIQSSSAGMMDMRPPTTPGFASHSQSQAHMQMQMARPGSSMGGGRPMSSGGQASGSGDGMFPPTSSPGMGMSGNMQGMAGMGGLSPDAQIRSRQMQMRQAQAMMYHQQQQQQAQQQHQQQQLANQQQHNLQQQQQAGMQGGNLAMSPLQRQAQATPSPTQQQQMMHAQATGARQMSPPGAGAGMGMGMNGADGLNSSQQGGMSSNMSQPGMNINGMGANTGSNMALNPQMISSMGPAAMTTYQILQNSQHPMTLYLNQQIPGFSQLPIMDQMRRFQMLQQQRQMQQGQRNQQMMANQMMSGQMRPPNANASGSGASQMQQQLGQGGQMGMAPQMQSSNSDGSIQFPGTPTSANMPTRTASSMGMSQQMGGLSGMSNMPNMGNLNPQQRQLYLMQMQMRSGGAGAGGGGGGGGGAGMNPSMMNPQMLAAAQERQRLEQQQQQRLALAQRQGSPLNPAANSGRDQFPPGLRSNPNAGVGIARTGRSPAVAGGDMTGAATPRMGGRILASSDDYQRQVLLQQAQRNAQIQQMQQQQQQQGFMQGQGQGQGGWPGQQQSQQLPLAAGAWPQQSQQGFSMGGSPPNSAMQAVDLMGPPRQTSATPAPMGQHSPNPPNSDFDNMMNW